MRDVPSRLTARGPNMGAGPTSGVAAGGVRPARGLVRFRGGYRGEQRTARTADAIAEAVSALLVKIGQDEPTHLAVRRAALTLVWDVRDVGDDSLGRLGMVSDELVRDYAAVDDVARTRRSSQQDSLSGVGRSYVSPDKRPRPPTDAQDGCSPSDGRCRPTHSRVGSRSRP